MNAEQDKQASRRVVAVAADLFFGSRISASARALGASCHQVRDAEGLERALTAGPVDVVFVDLALPETVVRDCLRTASSGAPHAERIAFYSHVRQMAAEAASAAGATRVMPHSRFTAELENLISGKVDPA